VALLASIGATSVIGVAMIVADRPGPTATVATSATTATAVTSTSAATAAKRTPTTAAPAAAGLRDGVFTGPAEYTKWGDVQVQVTVAGGKVTSVTAVQTPTEGKSQRINARATPVLEREAVAAQSADIDIVSGATYTSTTYAASLQAALDQAAGGTATAAP
jgi:uncharacterized protein with FMN-binding domain